MRKFALISLIALNVSLGLILGLKPAEAHSAAVMFPRVWAANSNVNYSIDNNIETGKRGAINFGMNGYSDRADGRSPNFVYQGIVNAFNDFNPCGLPGRIFQSDPATMTTRFGTGTLAATTTCVPAGQTRIQHFQITFVTDPQGAGYGTSTGWYLGNDAPGNTQSDLRSTAIHEAGHVAGSIHFDEGDATVCPEVNDDRATMCPGRLANVGTTYRRSLNVHDVHTIQGAY